MRRAQTCNRVLFQENNPTVPETTLGEGENL